MKRDSSCRRESSSCESCENYVYDEDYGYYVCEAQLDEDEMAHFLAGRQFDCPSTAWEPSTALWEKRYKPFKNRKTKGDDHERTGKNLHSRRD